MSVSNLLTTSTVNFQDLMGNGKSYSVPQYQRDYSWTQEQWEDLWQDILELRESPKNRHYMGAVVVKADRDNDRKFLIIDGQQRITTLTLLGLAVISCLKDLQSEGDSNGNGERAGQLRSRFIGEKDPASLTEISKLVLNEHDNGFFQDYLVQLRTPNNIRSLQKSNRLLYDCFQFFHKRVAQLFVGNSGQDLAGLISEVVARRLLFILITVEDEISAYTVFETLNARGLELTTTDLLKNYLFSRLAAQNDLVSVQRRWKGLVSTIQQERFGEFLRYHYLTKYKKIRSGRLFKMVRDEVTSPQQVLDLLDVLEERAELFEALYDSNHVLWSSHPEAREYIQELQLFRVKQATPLLFAAYERFSFSDFVRVLKFVAILSFRYTIVSGLNPSELEQAYSNAAIMVLNNQAGTPRRVSELLNSIYVDDEKFIADFSLLTLQTSPNRLKLAKFILIKLENLIQATNLNYQTDEATIEHILPQNPTDDWAEMIEDNRWEEVVDLVGNLTLLAPAANRNIGNSDYLSKLDAYRESRYRITQDIAAKAPLQWTIPLIQERQKRFAEKAAQVWRSDFA